MPESMLCTWYLFIKKKNKTFWVLYSSYIKLRPQTFDSVSVVFSLSCSWTKNPFSKTTMKTGQGFLRELENKLFQSKNVLFRDVSPGQRKGWGTIIIHEKCTRNMGKCAWLNTTFFHMYCYQYNHKFSFFLINTFMVAQNWKAQLSKRFLKCP